MRCDIAKLLDSIRRDTNPSQKKPVHDVRLPSAPPVKQRTKGQQFFRTHKKGMRWVVGVSLFIIVASIGIGILARPLFALAKLPQTGTYLVLFQNNAELRGGGGFLGSFAVVTLEGRHIKNYYFESNIYKKDNAFTKENKTPLPDYFYQFIGKDISLAMRDANYPADFATAAREVSKYYALEYGSSVDGIIAVNASAIADMLGVTGPLVVGEKNVSVSKDTFFDTLQREIQETYFNNDTNKMINEPKSILKDMIDPLMKRFNGVSPLSLYRYIMTELATKQILFWFPDAPRRSVVEQYNWGGRIQPWSDESVFISNTNVNGQKSSMSVDESLTLAGTTKSDPHRTLTFTRTHSGGDAYQANHINRNYSRIYLPLGTQIQSVKRDNSILNTHDYTIADEFDRTVVSVWTTVDVHQTMTTQISYSLPQSALHGKILYQKQPGVISQGLTITIGTIRFNSKNVTRDVTIQ